jgi:hypothetical protein
MKFIRTLLAMIVGVSLTTAMPAYSMHDNDHSGIVKDSQKDVQLIKGLKVR